MHEVTQFEVFFFLLKPFLISSISVIAISYFLRWMFEYSMEVEGVSENIWLFWIPGFFTLLFWVIFLRRRINLIDLPYWNDNGVFLAHSLTIISLSLAGIFSQFYQKRSNLELTSIDNVREIVTSDWTTCYRYNSIRIDRERIIGEEFSHTSGRYNDKMNYDAYMTAPIGESTYGNVVFWVGKTYHKSFSNRSSDGEKQQIWKAHYSSSYEHFEHINKSNGEYLYPVQRGEDLENYLAAINRFDWPKNVMHRVFEFYDGDISSESKSMILGSVISLISGIFLMLLFSLRGVKSAHSLVNYKSGKLKLNGGEKDVMQFLLLQGSSPITALIVYGCIAGYVISGFIDGNLFVMKSGRLLEFGAISNGLIQEGEYWRFLSYMFLHGGVMHLGYNLVILVMMGGGYGAEGWKVEI